MLPLLPRVPVLLLGMASLVLGVLAGLARLGTDVPAPAAVLAVSHGALMLAFFGTVISLERAVALGRNWALAAPLGAGLGGLVLILGGPMEVGQALFVLAALGLVAGSAVVLGKQPTLFNATLAGGALCWLGGTTAWWLTGSIHPAAAPWLAFLVLTIAGERLELTRFLLPPARARHLFVAIVLAIGAGALAAAAGLSWGLRLFAAALLAQAAWLIRYDIARKTVKQSGLTRFIAIALLTGYGWLAAGGLLGLLGGLEAGHPLRDAALHSLALGFVFSMVFGHAPIVLPAVAKLRIRYHPVLYLPLLLLQVSLALRIAGGLAGQAALHQGAGIGNGLALLLFIATMVTRILQSRRAAP